MDEREKLREQLKAAGIASAVYYPKPLHRHRHFGNVCRWTDLSVAERTAERCLSLPIFPEMTNEEIDYVASTTARLLS